MKKSYCPKYICLYLLKTIHCPPPVTITIFIVHWKPTSRYCSHIRGAVKSNGTSITSIQRDPSLKLWADFKNVKTRFVARGNAGCKSNLIQFISYIRWISWPAPLVKPKSKRTDSTNTTWIYLTIEYCIVLVVLSVFGQDFNQKQSHCSNVIVRTIAILYIYDW